MQVAFYLAGEITHVKESIPWVRCASGNVYSAAWSLFWAPKYWHFWPNQTVRRGFPVDCRVDNWRAWGSCSSKTNTRKRVRKVIRRSTDGGAACPDLGEKEQCAGGLFPFPFPPNLEVGLWTMILSFKTCILSTDVGVRDIYFERWLATWCKRWRCNDLKSHDDHWPESSACSSHLPSPSVLQKVSL